MDLLAGALLHAARRGRPVVHAEVGEGDRGLRVQKEAAAPASSLLLVERFPRDLQLGRRPAGLRGILVFAPSPRLLQNHLLHARVRGRPRVLGRSLLLLQGPLPLPRERHIQIVELGDTAFLILLKRRVLFLHWYHHAIIVVYVAHAGSFR